MKRKNRMENRRKRYGTKDLKVIKGPKNKNKKENEEDERMYKWMNGFEFRNQFLNLT